MSIARRSWSGLLKLLGTPIRLFRQRTVVQLMVSHVAVVLITFLLLNLLIVAVIIGWLPGRSLIGLEEATQDYFLGERTRSMAVWLDVDEIIAEYGSLDTPEARDELDARLDTILSNEIPGFHVEAAPTGGSVEAYFGIPRAALVADADGTVIASSDATLATEGEAVREIDHAGLRGVLERSLDLNGEPDPWAGIAYSVEVSGTVTSAATPLFDRNADVVGYLAFQGYPLPEILAKARTVILRETATSVLRTSWIYLIPAMLVALPFAYLRARSTSRRLERLAHLADAFADGDLHTRLRVTRRDEIGRLAERFNEMGTRIEQEARDRRAFLSNVSHELRTPVAIIQGTAEQLEAGTLHTPADKERAIALVHMEIQNLTRLIDDLSTLGRLEEAKLRLDPRPVDAHAIAADAVSGLKTMAWNQRKVTIENIVPPDLPPTFADPGRLRQVVHNLLFNALRHTPEGGLVVVQGAVAGDMMEISVSDTGVGIATDKLDHIFDRYYQTEMSRRLREGSGLGLHIVQQLVEAQGGTISVESEVGKGTTFRFTLPLSARGAERGGSTRRTGSDAV